MIEKCEKFLAIKSVTFENSITDLKDQSSQTRREIEWLLPRFVEAEKNLDSLIPQVSEMPQWINNVNNDLRHIKMN